MIKSKKKTSGVNLIALRDHLKEWMNDHANYQVSIEKIATITGKHKRHVKRDVKAMIARRGQAEGACEVLTGNDFLMLLAGYNIAISFDVVETLADLYANAS
ncbi:hypothetical protein FD733_02120 [Pantoea sp. Eser]|nr:hypothetical protein [Pantoea sp. Eser]